jgi:hypothetical protein
MTKEIILKGSLYGSKKIKEYSNPDILYSKVDSKICRGNKLSIKYNKEKKNFYIYHSYDIFDNNLSKIHYGRWYDTNFNFDLKLFDKKKNTLTIKLKKVEWENFDTGKSSIRDVKIIIYLSNLGYNKLLEYIKKISNN